MSYLVDYGPDYPSEPEPSRPARTKPVDWGKVGRRCINITAAYMLIAGLGLGGLSIREATQGPMQMRSPSQPHGAYGLTILSPSPHVAKTPRNTPPRNP